MIEDKGKSRTTQHSQASDNANVPAKQKKATPLTSKSKLKTVSTATDKPMKIETEKEKATETKKEPETKKDQEKEREEKELEQQDKEIEIVVERKDELLYKKKQPVFQCTNSNCPRKINIEAPQASHHHSLSHNNCLTTNNTNTNNKPRISAYNSNYNKHRHLFKNMVNYTANSSNENYKEDSSTNVHHYKSQSMTNIQLDNISKEINQENVSRLNEAIKQKLKRAYTHLFHKRLQSPTKVDSCLACNVDCNISSTGYSPMTYSPFGERIRRRSFTPTKGNSSC